MSKINVSVIVPTHNSEKYIRDVIASLRGQTYDDFEVVFVDSSSSDNTLNILLTEEKKDIRFRVIQDENGSYGHKINVGIENARGEYITILESDDRYKPDTLKRLWLVAEANHHKLDIIKGAYTTFEEVDGMVKETPVYHLSKQKYNNIVDIMGDKSYWDWSWHHIWTGIYKVSFLRDNNIRLNESPGASYQDSGFGVLTALLSKRVLYIPDLLYMYRRDNESSSVKDNSKYLFVKKEYDWIRQQIDERGLLTTRNKAYLNLFRRRAYRWNVDRLEKKYKEKFIEAIKDERTGRCKVSVILPSLNVSEYIEQCLKSVVEQSLQDIEILCVDAGSTDGTLQIIERFAKVDSRIRVLHSDKKSYGYQMNLGIREANGEYIGIVETDDYIDTDMYELLYSKAEIEKPDMVKGCYYEVFEDRNGKLTEELVDLVPDSHFYNNVFSPENDPTVHRWDCNIWTGIYRREFLRDNSICFNETSGAAYQDIGFQQRVLNEADSVIFLHNHVYHYRKIRPGASTWNSKCLGNIYYEYKDLFERGQLNQGRLRWIYARLISAFLFELDKALLYADYDIEKLECPEALDWFIESVSNGIKKGYVELEDQIDVIKGNIRQLIEDKELYVEQFASRMGKSKKYVSEIIDRISNNPVVVFGVGTYGMLLTKVLLVNGIQISAYADNQRNAVRNQSRFGKKVYSCDDAVRFFPDAFFIVACKNCSEAMVHQLNLNGIDNDQIGVFDNTKASEMIEIRRRPLLVVVD